MSSKVRLIGVTTGDPDGIGSEVTAKALRRIGPRRDARFVVWRSPQCPKKHLKWIDSSFCRVKVSSWQKAQEIGSLKSNEIIDIASDLSPGHWVVDAAKACLNGSLHGMATAPLSKVTIQQSGLNYIGHTDILKDLSQAKQVFMAFIGNSFNVLLATGHIPLSQVSSALTKKQLVEALSAANKLRQLLASRQRVRPIALVGLNPHAGEEGLLGKEELSVFAAALKSLSGKVPISGPLVPDAAFFKENWKRYSVFVAPYHDQGLIPFKMIHGQNSGIHVTMGLPFIRTSVDHGTAKDIFGKDKANETSMFEALLWSIKLTKAAVDTRF